MKTEWECNIKTEWECIDLNCTHWDGDMCRLGFCEPDTLEEEEMDNDKWECIENDAVIEYNGKQKEFIIRHEGEAEGTGIVIGLSDILYALTMAAPVPLHLL